MRYLLAVGGVALVVLAVQAWYRQWAQQQPDPALEIKPYRQIYFKADEQMAARTGKRREAADAIRARAARIETGERVSNVIRLAKR